MGMGANEMESGMSDPNQQAGKLPPLAGHAIQVLMQADPPAHQWDHQTTMMGALPPKAGDQNSSGDWLPEAIRPALGGRYDQSPVWQKTSIDAGSDFHKHLRNLVCGAREAKDLAVLWAATPLTLRLLQKADFYAEDTPPKDRATHRLLWRPNKSAARRLAAERDFPPAPVYGVAVSGLLYYAFRTGIGFAVAAVEIVPLDEPSLRPLERPLHPAELQEAVVAISRAGALSWQVPGQPPEPNSGFTFASILRNLTGGGGAPRRSIERIFTYSYAKFSTPVPAHQADRFALFLARHYTSDYALKYEIAGIPRVRDFETVGHVMALEGAATIVAPSAESGALPDFLENFEPGTWQQHYVPIALLAQHEHAFLVDKTTESNFWLSLENATAVPLPGDATPWYAYPPYRRPAAQSPHRKPTAAGTRQDIEKLEKLRLESLKFRLAFRFSQVSLIAMHNAVNRGFREALGLDRMQGELSMDVAEANEFLAQISEDRKKALQEKLEGRLFHAERIFGAILIGIGVFQVADLWYHDDGLSGKQIALHAAVWTAASILAAFTYQTLNEKLRQAKIEWAEK